MQIEQTANLLESLKNKNAGSQEGIMGVSNYIQKNKSQEGSSVNFIKSKEELGIFAGNSVNTVTYGKPENEENQIVDHLQKNMEMTMEQHRNEMAVLSNTMSPEDFQKMQEEGFYPYEMNRDTIITVSDKIKAVMAKAGAEISGDINEAAMEEITGSYALTKQIMKSLEARDLPATEENVSEGKRVYEQAMHLSPIDGSAMKYILRNGMEPTISNIYMAEHSSNQQESKTSVQHNYYSDMEQQIRTIIEKAGLQLDEETISDAEWMIENQIELTEENLKTYKELQKLSLEISSAVEDETAKAEFSQRVLGAITLAIAEGKKPQEGILVEHLSIQERAQEAWNTVQNTSDENLKFVLAHGQELTIQNLDRAMQRKEFLHNETVAEPAGSVDGGLVTARRQLEEVRLAMTVQANYSLIKKGMEIDTIPLQQLVEELKAQEKQFSQSLLQANGIEPTEENQNMFVDTTRIVSEMKLQPAYALTLESDSSTLKTIHEAGATLQDSFMRANQRYEVMMTTPRADMGDSIQKAFQNVDEILQDLSMDVSDSNRRAVRILAYNQMELKEENILKMKAVDENVQRTFHNLTPAVTLELIRRQENPLDLSIVELNQKAEEIQRELGVQEEERFSKFLYKLEQKNEISEEERSSYIGIYRLIAQVEKTDGALIGSLIRQESDVTMRTLLTALRSKNKSGMDYEIDDSFDGVNVKSSDVKIDDQILTAFQSNCIKDVMDRIAPEKLMEFDLSKLLDSTPEQLKETFEKMPEDEALNTAYEKEQLSQFSEGFIPSEDVYRFMEHYDITNSMINVTAVTRMLKSPKEMFDEFWKGAKEDTVKGLKQEVLERFAEAIKNPDELAEAQEELAEKAEHAMEGMIIEDPSARSVDLRRMKILARQFSVAANRAKEECFMIPLQVGDEVTGVSLKIVRGKKEKGLVDLIFESNSLGKVSASFEAKEGEISGTILTERTETREAFGKKITDIEEKIKENEQEKVDIHIVSGGDFSLEHQQILSIEREKKIEESSSNEQKENVVQTKRLYNIAEEFIKWIQSIER